MNDDDRLSVEQAPHILSVEWVRPDAVLVELGGDLDIATVPAVTGYLRHLTDHNPAHLILDVTAVSFFAAAAAGMLVTVQQAGTWSGRLNLIGVAENRFVSSVLELVDRLILTDRARAAVRLRVVDGNLRAEPATSSADRTSRPGDPEAAGGGDDRLRRPPAVTGAGPGVDSYRSAR